MSAGFAAAPESYAYDAEGNRTASHLSAAHVHDAANRLIEDDGFCYGYDANGNLTSKTAKVAGACTGGLTVYTWDVQNRLVRIDFPGGGFAAYRYDADGRRIEKDVDGTITRYLYDDDDIVLEFDGANALSARYSHGEETDQPLVLERGGQSHFYHVDFLGSVRSLTNAAGTVINSYDYDAYGNFETRSELVANPYTYTAREFDPESGLHFYRARYYDPVAGRFLSEDPACFSASDLNLYRYAFNSPVNAVDPSGTISLSQQALLLTSGTIVAIAIAGSQNGNNGPLENITLVPSGPLPFDPPPEPDCEEFTRLCIAFCRAQAGFLFPLCATSCAAQGLLCLFNPGDV